MESILCIDIGYVNPSFIIIEYENEINSIQIYDNIKFPKNNYENLISLILEYFISEKINLVIIENQCHINNIILLNFIKGYLYARNITTLIKRPISHLRTNKKDITRAAKKGFSVDLLNNFLSKQKFNKKFLKKDSDICDAINLGLKYIHDKKYNKKNFIDNFDIQIKEIVCYELNLSE